MESGKRVRILTNSLSANDVPLVHAGYMRYREDLVKGGVELYEFKAIKGVPKEKKKTKASLVGSLHPNGNSRLPPILILSKAEK